MKVAIVHYWLVNDRGGEKVLEALCEMYPGADIFTHVYDPDSISEKIRKHRVHTTFIQRLPRAMRWYQYYLPFMPLALENLDLREYDLVISSESGPAKGVLVKSDALHVCYCHSPMRYAWDLYHDYMESQPRWKRLIMAPLLHYMRNWDALSALRVDAFVANSDNVRKRIRRSYRRPATVVYPPVEVKDFSIGRTTGDHYLFLGQLIPYKQAELAVRAFNRLGKRLVVVGTGSEERRLRELSGPYVEMRGWESRERVVALLMSCKALIFPGNEDFGIVPVEAMAAGKPVIAYRAGGALETVVEGKTGVFFDQPTVSSLVNAVNRFESMENTFDPEQIRQHAWGFDRSIFKRRMMAAVHEALEKRRNIPEQEHRVGGGEL